MAPDPKSSLSADQKEKVAKDCFRRGTEAMGKENWDYAIQMYSTSVKMVPDNLLYRQTLRGTERKKYGNNGSGASMAGMKLMGPKTKIKKARYGKAWGDLDEAAEEGLAVNPWDSQLNADLGDAARELGYVEVAIFAYECCIERDPSNKDVNRLLAVLLEEKGEYLRAKQCWERVLKSDPYSGEARSKIVALDASSVMDRGGYEGASNTKGVMADHEVARRLGKTKDGTADGPGMSVEADLQRAIRKEPANKDNYLKLADYYKREGQLQEAEAQLRKALEASNGDVSIRELLEDVQVELLRQSLTVARDEATNNPDQPDLKKRAGELAKELLQREIEVLSNRIGRYPADMRIKFELGQRYMRVQEWRQAIPLFQASRADERIKAESLIALGKCFVYDKNMQLGRRQFESAIPGLKFDEKPDVFRDLFYSLGRLCEEMKDIPAAEQYYQEVLGVDYGYRDAVARLDRLQSGGKAAAQE